MPTVIPVKFTYAARDLWFDPKDTGAVEADHVICRTERGLEIGIVTAGAHEVTEEDRRSLCGDAALKPVLRVADDVDLELADELAERGDAALPVFRRLVIELGLDMKPVGVEYLFGGEKVVCYFSAEERVDFRQLVRDMARELHERIDMRQIGVREEAAIVGGFAHCGQELCCARFGHQFEPVSIRMAKEQDLPLNSAKISGACGRLMCCLRYEFEAYRDFKGRAPKRNAVIETPLGKGKIVEYDTPKEQVTLRLENGKQVRVALADMEASEAAVRKSEELGCPCRPDTAGRAALERLASPEVKLALAELDREMGVLAEKGPSDSDLFVEPSRPRRRRGPDPAATQQPRPIDAQGAAGGAGKRSRRRRKGRAADAEGGRSLPPDASPRPAEAPPKGAGDSQGAAKSRRRRRHHSADEPSRAPSDGVTQEQQGTRRARRRPGDRGGAQAQQPSQASGPKQPPRDVAAAPAEGPGSAEPRYPRRHRGRGRGRGGSEGGPDPQGNPAE